MPYAVRRKSGRLALVICILAGVGVGRAAKVEPGVAVDVPLVLYDDCGGMDRMFRATGWMGDADAIRRDECCTEMPYSGTTCIKNKYIASGMWCGIIWQNKANDWGDSPGGVDLSKAKKLTFWARGEEGGERIEIKFGVLGKDKTFPDSIKEESKSIRLSKEWKKYSIPVSGNKQCVKTGFGWIVDAGADDLTFYFDDIQYE
ncbi:MAG: hypothetical protein EOM20_08825 [Spartobacteria bacterium]|nr:hypothetical protein [Spartobacteria bacterium]